MSSDPNTADSSHAAVSLKSLPHFNSAQIAMWFGGLIRPGAGHSRLWSRGDRFVVTPPLTPTVLVTRSPDDAKAVFGNDQFSFGEVLRRFTAHDVIFGTDMFIFLEGHEHRDERKRLSAPLHGRALKSYEDAMADAVTNRLARWPVGRPTSFLRIGYELALDVMLSVIFGPMSSARLTPIEKAMHSWIAAMENPAFLGVSAVSLIAGGKTVPYAPLTRGEAAVDAAILREINIRRSSGFESNGGILDHYLNNAIEGEGDGKIASVLRGMVFAGYETTAVTLGWIGEFIARKPDVARRVHDTVRDGDDSYLDAVVLEAMRLRPAIPLTGRRALNDTKMNGIHIRKGNTVMIPLLALHERADLYENATTFDPERFVGRGPGASTWLTFGGGAHRCAGGSFALFEARALMRTVLQHRTIVSSAGKVASPRRIHPMLIPANGAPVTLSPR